MLKHKSTYDSNTFGKTKVYISYDQKDKKYLNQIINSILETKDCTVFYYDVIENEESYDDLITSAKGSGMIFKSARLIEEKNRTVNEIKEKALQLGISF